MTKDEQLNKLAEKGAELKSYIVEVDETITIVNQLVEKINMLIFEIGIEIRRELEND